MSAGERQQNVALVGALLVLVVLLALDIVLPGTVLSGSYALAALITGAVTTVRRTAVMAVLAFALSSVSWIWNDNFASLDWDIRLVLTFIVGALAVVIATIRVRREHDLRRMTVIAETAQRAVLRAMPSAVGSLGFAARYVSATREALVGGDLYEVAESPYGVRVIVGDVRGKGLDAVQLAGTVLGAFRRSAFTQERLADIARDLDAVVQAVAGDEDFVTAVLAEFHDDHTVTMVNCGHHPPLLVTGDSGAEVVPTGTPEPPLGLGPVPTSVTSGWPDGSRMLIYTDGLVEARDRRGTFFPLGENAPLLRAGSLDEALDRLLDRLVAHTGRQITDDLALVLVEHRTT
ncbi:PP2C family protein-serine/threonine phosphatase [Nocardioides sp. MAHUQ-72]|uniref:PP2C family protein-serine/threonine phosphatase n=1 Tax=unclassified Nocardioides TaxID=2615069 RepID=UPI00361C81AE